MASVGEATEEDAGIDSEVEEEDESPDFDEPLALLTSVSTRLLSGDIPTSPTRLQSLFNHIQSVVGELVDASFAKITGAFDQLEEVNENLREDGEGGPQAEAFFQEFEAGREHVEEGLAIMHETFFSAQNFDDLEEFEEEFREAEVQLAEGLGRIEQAMLKAENPEMFGLHQDVSSENVEDALDAIASSLDALTTHLEDGKPSHLEFVLERIDEAREFIENALEESRANEVEEETETEGE